MIYLTSIFIYRTHNYSTIDFSTDSNIDLFMFNYSPMPLTTGINSINPDYMEDVYIPDEWELGREKVKIGCALGQGSFGMVYEGEARDLLETDKKLRKVAIKTTNNAASLLDQIQFLNEASRMK